MRSSMLGFILQIGMQLTKENYTNLQATTAIAAKKLALIALEEEIDEGTLKK